MGRLCALELRASQCGLARVSYPLAPRGYNWKIKQRTEAVTRLQELLELWRPVVLSLLLAA